MRRRCAKLSSLGLIQHTRAARPPERAYSVITSLTHTHAAPSAWLQALGDLDVSQAADGNGMLDNASGAGAYVHGLEDEFEAVRLAAIDSLCELSLNIPTIADKAVEYLVRECVVKTSPAGEGPVACPKRLEAFASLEALSASPSYPLSHLGAPATSLTHLPSSRMGCGVSQMDMMNDELESVRLNAVQSLSKLATLTTLTQDMVVVLLQALDDPNPYPNPNPRHAHHAHARHGGGAAAGARRP
jgi:hypothetical protein